MNVKELTFRGEDKAALYACGKCGTCYSPRTYAVGGEAAHQAARQAAERCCVTPTCSVCGGEVSRPWTMCPKHREQAGLRRANPIPAADWKDPVHRDDMRGDWGEGYSSSVSDLLEWWADENWVEVGPVPSAPAYCWPCVPTDFRLDVERILEGVLNEFHEGAADEIVDADSLYDFVEAWNQKQTLRTWYPDHTRVIVLDEDRFKDLLQGDG